MGDTQNATLWQRCGAKSPLWSSLCLRHRQGLVMLIFRGSSELTSGQVLFNRDFLERAGSPCAPCPCVVGQSWRRTRAQSGAFF